jgi:hypothetical protein
MGMTLGVHAKDLFHIRIDLDCEAAGAQGPFGRHIVLSIRVFDSIGLCRATSLSRTYKFMSFSPGPVAVSYVFVLSDELNPLVVLFNVEPFLKSIPRGPVQRKAMEAIGDEAAS